MAQILPYPYDIYTDALEEFLLLHAAVGLLKAQGDPQIPLEMGLAVRNDIISWAMQALEPANQAAYMDYVRDLNRHLRRYLPTYLPEPIGTPGPSSPPAEHLAWHFLADGSSTLWGAVRQAVALLDWQADKHSFSGKQPANVTLGAFGHGPHCGIRSGTTQHPSFCRLVNRLIQHLCPKHVWTTFALNRDLRTPPHKDQGNAPTGSLLTCLTHNEGGELWLEEGNGSAEAATEDARCGSIIRLSMQSLLFPAHSMMHCTCDWTMTRRVTLSAFCIGKVRHLKAADVQLLEDYGFCPFDYSSASN